MFGFAANHCKNGMILIKKDFNSDNMHTLCTRLSSIQLIGSISIFDPDHGLTFWLSWKRTATFFVSSFVCSFHINRSKATVWQILRVTADEIKTFTVTLSNRWKWAHFEEDNQINLSELTCSNMHFNSILPLYFLFPSSFFLI